MKTKLLSAYFRQWHANILHIFNSIGKKMLLGVLRLKRYFISQMIKQKYEYEFLLLNLDFEGFVFFFDKYIKVLFSSISAHIDPLNFLVQLSHSVSNRKTVVKIAITFVGANQPPYYYDQMPHKFGYKLYCIMLTPNMLSKMLKTTQKRLWNSHLLCLFKYVQVKNLLRYISYCRS